MLYGVRKEVSLNNFGLVIAYLLPGFTLLWGVSFLDSAWALPFIDPGNTESTIADFLYSTVTALAAGLIVSTIRWMLIDTLHHCTGIRKPNWNFALLSDRTDAYEMIVESHYRYYQFNANFLTSLVIAYTIWRCTHPVALQVADAVAGTLALILYLGSRDTLSKYYERTGQLLKKRSS